VRQPEENSGEISEALRARAMQTFKAAQSEQKRK